MGGAWEHATQVSHCGCEGCALIDSKQQEVGVVWEQEVGGAWEQLLPHLSSLAHCGRDMFCANSHSDMDTQIHATLTKPVYSKYY